MLLEIAHLEQRAGAVAGLDRTPSPVTSRLRAGGRRASRRPSGRVGAAPAVDRPRGTPRWRRRSAAQRCNPAGSAASEGTMPLISFSRARRVSVRAAVVEVGDRAEQPLRVGVPRMVEQLVGARLLHLAARVHHHHPVGVLGDHAHVVGDEDDRGAERVLQLAHQVEDLGLDGHVERRGRLVGDEHLGIARQRHGDHDALAHAARELVRIGVRAPLGLGNVDALQHLDGLGSWPRAATVPGAGRSPR